MDAKKSDMRHLLFYDICRHKVPVVLGFVVKQVRKSTFLTETEKFYCKNRPLVFTSLLDYKILLPPNLLRPGHLTSTSALYSS